MASEIALQLDGVDACYGDSHVLHDVGFALRAHSVLALLGRNGAGKTTCMSTVMGFLRPRAGRIKMFGQDLAGLPPELIVRAGVGLVPQGRRIFPSLTVRENLVVAALGPRNAPWHMERVFQTFPRLRERRSQAAGLMSGGEQQMLAIGRALMGNPRVLLMDEPSEGLAPQIVAEVGRVIARLKEEGLSIVLVEQNLKLALSLADDVAIVNTGAIALTCSAAALAADQDAISRHLGVF